MSETSISEILNRVEELSRKIEEYEKSRQAQTPQVQAVQAPTTPQVQQVQAQAPTSVVSVRGSKAVEALRKLCEAVGGRLITPPENPEKPLCLIDHVYGLDIVYDRKRNADVVSIHKFKEVQYRQVGSVRRREIVTETGTLEIIPQRSIKFEVDFFDTTKTATMPSLVETVGNYYSTVAISRRSRSISPQRTVSMACTATDTREHKITCVLFSRPEVPYKFEFDTRTKRWKLIKGSRRIDVFRGI